MSEANAGYEDPEDVVEGTEMTSTNLKPTRSDTEDVSVNQLLPYLQSKLQEQEQLAQHFKVLSAF